MALGFTLEIVCSEDVAQQREETIPPIFRRDSCATPTTAASSLFCAPWPQRSLVPAEMFEPIACFDSGARDFRRSGDPVTPPALGDTRARAIHAARARHRYPAAITRIARTLAWPRNHRGVSRGSAARGPRPHYSPPAARGTDAALRNRRDDGGGLSHDRSQRAAQVFCPRPWPSAASTSRPQTARSRPCSAATARARRPLSPHDRRGSYARTGQRPRDDRPHRRAPRTSLARSARLGFCTRTSAFIRC